MDVPQTRYARTADGIHVGYQVVGSGPTDLVFVPYDYSNIEASWDFPPFVSFVRAMTTVGRLILFDRRGSGTSDRTWSGGSATIEAQMDDIRAVMDEVGSERAFIFGIESGAALCFTFAATHPQRTSGVIVHGALARGTQSPDYEALWTHEDFESWYDRVEREWGQPAFVRELFEVLSPSLAGDESLVRAFGRVLRLSASPGDAIARDRAVEETDIRHILPTVQVPTLVLHRIDDRLEMVEQARYIAAHTPGAKLVELPGEDHIYPLEDLIPHIAAFVESMRVEQAEFDRVLATVMYTDIVDSTARTAVVGDARWQEIRSQHDAIVRSQIARYRGREIKSMGDGFLVTFDGPARGVKCARTIADAVRALGIEIRAGLHTGEIALEGSDVSGLGVVIGARIGALAGASEVLVSQTVKDLVAGSGLAFEDAGERELKGVPDRWRLYRVTV